MADLFAAVELAPADPIIGTAAACNADPHPDKVNLGIGAYRTDEGKPYVFASVKEAERRIIADPSINKEYLPIDGHPGFNRLARNLVFGSDSAPVRENRVATVQSISGTGSLRLGAEFIGGYLQVPAVYVSNPTWGNHIAIFKKAGLEVREYPYFNSETRLLKFDGMCEALNAAPPQSVILLHACAHNPTGVDLTEEQWATVAEIMQSRSLIPYFDSAYQGFATGSLENDAFALREFVRRGFQLFLSQSFAKNMGLYGERTGALHVVCANSDSAERVLSQLKIVIRANYSSPPLHGALLAYTILNDEALTASWKEELTAVSHRILAMRHKLVEELVAIETPGDWSHIVKQIGMFSYTGLTSPQCEVMISKWHCYLVKNGRISMAGVNTHNVGYIARAIKDSILSA
jgi:aspartate/tyrosine/aromatic aminotransferase